MIFKYNEKVNVKDICDLRQSVGWNRMEKEMADPRLNSYYHIAVYEEENQKLIGFVDSVSNGVTDAYIQDLMQNILFDTSQNRQCSSGENLRSDQKYPEPLPSKAT